MLYIFDLDGTLRVTKSGRPCPNLPDDQALLPGVYGYLYFLREQDHSLATASNQLGVQCGYFTQKQAEEVNVAFLGMMAPIHFSCSELAFSEQYAKPHPGMILACMAKAQVRPEKVVFVGNAYVDRAAAFAAGVSFAWAHDFFHWGEDFVVENEHGFHPREWFAKWQAYKEAQQWQVSKLKS